MLSLATCILSDKRSETAARSSLFIHDVAAFLFVFLCVFCFSPSYLRRFRSQSFCRGCNSQGVCVRPEILRCSGLSFQPCFASTETVRTIRDGKPTTATSTFTQLLSSVASLVWPYINILQQNLLLLLPSSSTVNRADHYWHSRSCEKERKKEWKLVGYRWDGGREGGGGGSCDR